MNPAKNLLGQGCRLIGRRNLYRVSRYLMRAARGDVTNDPQSNGEQMLQEHVLRTSASPATVFDVGANLGHWTASLLRLAGEMHVAVNVHAFEPCQATFLRLSERARQWPQVRVSKVACSRHPGTAVMHVYGDGFGTNSLTEPVDGRVSESEEVSLTTIDRYCADGGVESIDLLKVDAEGHDFEVLAGAARMLDKHAVRFLQFEYNQRWIGARNYLRDAFDFLQPMGYAIGKLAGPHVEFYPSWHWEMENYAEGNFIACTEAESRRMERRQPTWLAALSGLTMPQTSNAGTN